MSRQEAGAKNRRKRSFMKALRALINNRPRWRRGGIEIDANSGFLRVGNEIKYHEVTRGVSTGITYSSIAHLAVM